MNKVDVFIISIPKFDSPLIRDFIHKYYNLFNKVYYVFNYIGTNQLTDLENDYINFIQNDLKDKCEFIHQLNYNFSEYDWRGLSINTILSKSTGDYIFSIEPDFTADWEKLTDIMVNKSYDLLSYYHGNPEQPERGIRIWPSFWGCNRKLLDSLDKNFSAMPDPGVKKLYKISYNKRLSFINNKIVSIDSDEYTSYDHFDYVSTQLVEKSCDDGNKILLLNRMENIWYEHISGITYDFSCIKNENKLYRPIDYYKRFFEKCKMCNVNFIKDWEETSEKIINYKFL